MERLVPDLLFEYQQSCSPGGELSKGGELMEIRNPLEDPVGLVENGFKPILVGSATEGQIGRPADDRLKQDRIRSTARSTEEFTRRNSPAGHTIKGGVEVQSHNIGFPSLSHNTFGWGREEDGMGLEIGRDKMEMGLEVGCEREMERGELGLGLGDEDGKEKKMEMGLK